MTDHARSLEIEASAAAALLENLSQSVVVEDEADTLIRDMIEGETGLYEAIDVAIERMATADAHADALAEMIKKLQARKRRFEDQKDAIRLSLAAAMETIGEKKIERPGGTLSLKATPPTAVITDEALLPPEFWVPVDPKLDKRKLTAALKDGREIEGAWLNNGGSTVQVKTT